YILLALAIHVASQHVPRARRVLLGSALIAFVAASAYGLNNFWFDTRYAEDDLRGAVAHIAENWRPGDAILVNAGYAYPALEYYFPPPVPPRERLVNFQ